MTGRSARPTFSRWKLQKFEDLLGYGLRRVEIEPVSWEFTKMARLHDAIIPPTLHIMLRLVNTTYDSVDRLEVKDLVSKWLEAVSL